jgi:hypothetical protein
MKFNLPAGVNSSKLSQFVEKVKDWEAANGKQALACSRCISLSFQRVHELRQPSLPRKEKQNHESKERDKEK